MIETIVFVIGCLLGVFTVIVIQKTYDWIDGLASRVERLKFELGHYNRERELWGEFHDWKRTTKGKE
jgi:hypothetical protein